MAHLYKLGLENFRVFKGYSEISFAPITILTGSNNSGKSSVIKAIQLLGRNLLHNESDSIFKLSFTSDEHKLSSYEDVVNDQSKPLKFMTSTIMEEIDEILSVVLTYERNKTNTLGEGALKRIELFSAAGEKVFDYLRLQNSVNVLTDFKYFIDKLIHRMEQKTKDYEDYKKLELNITNMVDARLIYHPYRLPSCFLVKPPYASGKLHFNSVPLIVNTTLDQPKSSSFYTRGFDLNEMLSPPLIALILVAQEIIDLKLFVEKYIIPKQVSQKDIISYLRTQICKSDLEVHNIIKKTESHILQLLSELEKTRILSEDSLFGIEDQYQLQFNEIYNLKYLLQNSLTEIVYNQNPTDETLRTIQLLLPDLSTGKPDNLDYLLHQYLSKNLSTLLQNAAKYYERIHKIDSIRANTQRLYTYKSQGTSFNSLLLEILQKDLLSFPDRKAFLKKWLDKFEIKGELEIVNSNGIGIYVSIDGRPLADLGYGFTQLIPILLKIIHVEDSYNDDGIHIDDPNRDYYISSTIIIEEPETNLHPKLQSLLADLFVDASQNYRIQFIIETHSEYLIRKLQYLTATGNITPNDTSIYYFHYPKAIPTGEKQVKKIEIQKDGSLSEEFGTGFFDEALNWKFELLKLKNKN